MRIAKQSVTIMGDRGLYTVSGADTLNKGQFSFGTAWNNVDRTPRDIDINSFPVHFSYGLTGRLTLTGALETRRQVTARNLSQTGFNNEVPFVNAPFASGTGDTILAAKYRLQRKRDMVGGVSVGGFVKIGTAGAGKGLGTGATDAGVRLMFTSQLPLSVLLHSTMAFVSTGTAQEPQALGIQDQIRSGIGLAWPSTGLDIDFLSSRTGGTFQGIFEYSSATLIGGGAQNAASSAVQNPRDLAAGVRYFVLDRGITVDAGYRRNINFDFSFPNNTNHHGWTFGVSYTKPVPVSMARNQYPVVALESTAQTISRGGSTTITATGFDADNDSLTYSWVAPAGLITGSAERVIFNAAGITPGVYTVRATASDGKGGIAFGQIDITVRP
jgi:hypothetical protein